MQNWLDRFTQITPFVVRHAYSAVSCVDDDKPVVVLARHPTGAASLAKFASAHNRVDSDHVPRVDGPFEFDEIEYVVVQFPGVTSVRQLLRGLEPETRIPHPVASALCTLLLEAAHRAHLAGGTLGSTCFDHLWVSRSGSLAVVGIDDTLAGQPGETIDGVYRARSVAMGGQSTPGTDAWAVNMLIQGIDRRVDHPEPIRRILMGKPLATELSLAAKMGAMRHELADSEPPGVVELMQRWRAIWREVGSLDDQDALKSWLAERVASAAPPWRKSPVADVVHRYEVGAWSIDLRTETIDGPETVELTRQEWDIFRYLLRANGRTVSKSELLVNVLGYAKDTKSRALDEAWKRMKRKLEAHAPEQLGTIWGKGLQVTGKPV
jgi:hypothetical protein